MHIPKKYTPFIFTALVFAVLAIAACLYGLAQVRDFEWRDENPNVNAIITTDIDTSNWKAYRNEKYGFEFKYPEGWEIVDLDNTGVGLLPPWKKQNIEYNGDTRIFIRENVKHLSMQDFYNGQSMPNLFKDAIDGYKSIRTDNQKGIIFNKVLGLSTSDIVVIDFEDYFMEVEATDNFDIFRSIINTIKTK